MNRKAESAYLFYDVLSGFFQPPTDLQGRQHTLARLALATFQKGDRQPSSHDKFKYQPSWAIGSVTIAEALRTGELQNLMISQEIPGSGSNWASISQWGSRALSGPQVHVMDSTGFEVVQPLQMGNLNQVRQQTTEVAQGFYDRLQTTLKSLPATVRGMMPELNGPQGS
jgi:hypothetical protein